MRVYITAARTPPRSARAERTMRIELLGAARAPTVVRNPGYPLNSFRSLRLCHATASGMNQGRPV